MVGAIDSEGMGKKVQKQQLVIVWFKRDLRLHDHAPLLAACETGYPVLPLYLVEPDYWAQETHSRRHWAFLHDGLHELRADLAALGQPLIVRQAEAVDALAALAEKFEIKALFAHEETGNAWTYARDMAVAQWCRGAQIDFHEMPCNGVVRRLKNRDAWARLRQQRMALPVLEKPAALKPLSDMTPDMDLGDIPSPDDALFGAPLMGEVQKGGRREAVQLLTSFLTERSQQYLACLSAPGLSEDYASRLSAHLAWGSLSVKEVVQAVAAFREKSPPSNPYHQRSLSAFQSRLSWRCHFIQKLEDQTELETQCMHSFFEGMREPEHNEAFFQAWKDGLTGYPFIDACMRNLKQKGWITFRMRAMLVSFASYHLWLDWRVTGKFLAQLFTDYEPGIHYSQLQMQSGVTGINSLRIYNPHKQAQDHDPNGDFIRQWVPELRAVDNAFIHEPSLMDMAQQKACGVEIGQDYPVPIVTHLDAVRAARAKIAAIRQQPGFREEAQAVFQKLGSRKKPTRRRVQSAKSRSQKTAKAGGKTKNTQQLSLFEPK